MHDIFHLICFSIFRCFFVILIIFSAFLIFFLSLVSSNCFTIFKWYMRFECLLSLFWQACRKCRIVLNRHKSTSVFLHHFCSHPPIKVILGSNRRYRRSQKKFFVVDKQNRFLRKNRFFFRIFIILNRICTIQMTITSISHPLWRWSNWATPMGSHGL